jgi:hypothetical protein
MLKSDATTNQDRPDAKCRRTFDDMSRHRHLSSLLIYDRYITDPICVGMQDTIVAIESLPLDDVEHEM